MKRFPRTLRRYPRGLVLGVYGDWRRYPRLLRHPRLSSEQSITYCPCGRPSNLIMQYMQPRDKRGRVMIGAGYLPMGFCCEACRDCQLFHDRLEVTARVLAWNKTGSASLYGERVTEPEVHFRRKVV